MSSDPVCQPPGLVKLHRFASPLVQMYEDVHVVAKVRLSPDQNDGRGRVAGSDLRDPLGGDVVEGDGVDEAEAEDEDVHMGVAQRAEVAELLLSEQNMRDEEGKD